MRIKHVRRAKKEFIEEFLGKEPYRKYINYVGINIEGGLGIRVGLRSELPKHVSLPSVYKEIPIIVEVVGEIKPQ